MGDSDTDSVTDASMADTVTTTWGARLRPNPRPSPGALDTTAWVDTDSDTDSVTDASMADTVTTTASARLKLRPTPRLTPLSSTPAMATPLTTVDTTAWVDTMVDTSGERSKP